MARHVANRKKNTKWGILITIVILASIGLVIWSLMMQRFVEKPVMSNEIIKDEDASYVETSVLNGRRFEENDVYQMYDDQMLHYAYITVMPTVDDKTGNDVMLSDLNSVKTYDENPVVEVLFQEGTIDGPDAEVYDSAVIRANATMKVRGFSARLQQQKSFKVELSGVANDFLGQSKLNFNKHFTDPLRISNKFCMDAFEEISDIGSLNTYFVKLMIRDFSKDMDSGYVDYGLFTMVEQPNKKYLSTHGMDKNGNLYKAIDFNFSEEQTQIVSQDDPYYDKAAFESILEIRENPDHEKVIDMIAAVNDSKNNINEVVSTYFNRENYLTWMATNIIFGNIDATANNFLLYSPVSSKTWYFVPWDYDKTLLFSKKDIEEYGGFTKSIYGMANFWGITLHNRFFKDPQNIADLNDRIDDIMANNLSPAQCNELTKSYRSIYEQAVFVLPDVGKLIISADEMAYYGDNIYDILTYYVDLYYRNLELPMPIFMSEVEKTNGEYLFEWDQAYDFQGDTVNYTLEVARDLDFYNVVYSANNLLGTAHTAKLDLEPDTYYYRVIIFDEKGNEQISLETYMDPLSGTEYFGLIPFEVD
jgi:spore coat protein H